MPHAREGVRQRPGLRTLGANPGESRCTQSAQINNVIGENENCLLFDRKTLSGLCGPPDSWQGRCRAGGALCRAH